jgi:hypothetical protein
LNVIEEPLQWINDNVKFNHEQFDKHLFPASYKEPTRNEVKEENPGDLSSCEHSDSFGSMESESISNFEIDPKRVSNEWPFIEKER